MANTKLIDCFPYFNEKELLELRIKLLYDHVEKFVITEANQTHSGLPKEYTCEEVLKTIDDPLNKIELIQVDYLGDSSVTYDHWGRERRQRDAALQLLHTFDDDCLFYFGDCDEILDPTRIEWICDVARNYPDNILRLPLVFLNCRADLRLFNENDEPMEWKCGYIASKKHLARYTPSQIRESSAMAATITTSELGRFIDFPDITITLNGVRVVFGWHFAWMGDNSRRQLKCKSYLHCHDHVPGSVAPLNSEGMMTYMGRYVPAEGATDPLGRPDHILRKYDISLLPDLILKEKKFKDFFLPDENYESIIDLLQSNPEISTDKNSVKYYSKSIEWDFLQYHSYIDNFYNEEFKRYKNKNINLCEIGIDTGGSIAIWSKYFPDANIIGIDNNTTRLKDEYKSENFDNVRYIIDDAYDQNLVSTLPNFDIIIDDGPHTLQSQKEFIRLYSSKLNPRGIMIIEDVKSIDYIDEFDSILMPGYTSRYIDLTKIDNLYDSILYIITR
jgi:hypothetical protein